jgi:hypothetical protein
MLVGFTHSPIQDDEIRLIHLKPLGQAASAGVQLSSPASSAPSSAQDDIVSCSIKVFKRGQAPPYIALSYAWGTEGTPKALNIGGETCAVSATVEAALRQVRNPHLETETWLWVDQISIDQRNEAEKSHQVQEMRNIYSEAALVIAWLGDNEGSSELLFSHLAKMSAALFEEDYSQVFKMYTDQETLSGISSAFQEFCNRPYWKRLWIIQELALAKDVTLLAGTAVVSVRAVNKVLAFVNKLISQASSIPDTVASKDSIPIITALFKTPATSFMEGVLSRRTRYHNAKIIAANQEKDPNFKQDDGANPCLEDNFFRVLLSSLVLEVDYNHPQTTDPRDRIFSVLSLANDGHEFATFPDYSMGCADVYRVAALTFLSQGHVGLLSYCQFPHTLQGLPSWVPDWSAEVRGPCCRAPWFSKFKASGSFPAQVIASPSRDTLSLTGLSVDKIAQVGTVEWDPDWLAPVDAATALAYISEVRSFRSASTWLRTTENDINLDIARIAIGDAGGFEDPAWPPVCFELYQEGMASLNDSVKSIPPPSPSASTPSSTSSTSKRSMTRHASFGDQQVLYLRLLKRLHSRRAFISETGYVGFCPAHARPGDEIVIFLGGYTPYTLRAAGAGTDGNESHTLVGETYVHGIMFGELTRENPSFREFFLK